MRVGLLPARALLISWAQLMGSCLLVLRAPGPLSTRPSSAYPPLSFFPCPCACSALPVAALGSGTGKTHMSRSVKERDLCMGGGREQFGEGNQGLNQSHRGLIWEGCRCGTKWEPRYHGLPFARYLASHGHPGDQVGALIVPDRGFVYSFTRWGMRKGRAAHGPEMLWINCPVAQLMGYLSRGQGGPGHGYMSCHCGPCLP